MRVTCVKMSLGYRVTVKQTYNLGEFSICQVRREVAELSNRSPVYSFDDKEHETSTQYLLEYGQLFSAFQDLVGIVSSVFLICVI